jgi:quercetin dioxygenase-like cupin family protein
VDSHRVETGPFEFMNLHWDYTAIDAEHTKLVWSQDFHMKPAAPIDDAGMQDRLNRNTVIQQKAVKAAVENLRARVVDRDDAPVNRRRGADLRAMLTPPNVGSTSGFSGTVLVAPGEVITEHYHPYSEEFIHVVEGELRVDVENDSRTARADQAVFIPKNTRHRIVNDSGAPVRVVFFLAPLAPRPELGHVDTESLDDYMGTANDETNRGNGARSGGAGRQHA